MATMRAVLHGVSASVVGATSVRRLRALGHGSRAASGGEVEAEWGARRAGGLDRRVGCAVGFGAVAGAMVALPHHAAAAAEVASGLDAWSALVASEPQNALSLPTWIIHVASVAECRVPLPCRVIESVFGSREVQSSFRETELTNALSLPTWFIHVASVVEWVTAMALVWRYGDTPGNSTWKGLSWGMVPLLGGAMCACTWHFFYNAPSLEILVVLQAALTLIGNFTMWIAAFRIYQSSQKQSKSPQ